MSLREKMKKMGSLLRSVSRFTMRTMGKRGLHPRGLSPLFLWRECGTIQQAILAKCDELLSKSDSSKMDRGIECGFADDISNAYLTVSYKLTRF